MTDRFVHLVIVDDEGVEHRREIPYIDPELVPAEQVRDPAQDAKHRAHARIVVAVPGIGLVSFLDDLDD